MQIKDILSNNFTTILLIIGTLILILVNKRFNRKVNRYFFVCLLMVLLLTCCDILDYYFSKFEQIHYSIRYIVSALGYTLRPSIIVIIIQILTRKNKFNFLLWVPVFILGITAFTSEFTHIMFWYTTDNNFMRGTFTYLPHVISFGYLLVLLVTTINGNKHLSVGEIFLIIYFLSACIITTYLESEYDVKLLLPGAMSVSCALYYIILNLESYKVDSMTELLNRKSFYVDTARWNSCSYALISIDLNELKMINDTYGHQAGDAAICKFASTVFNIAVKNYNLYRVGGDEFMAIGKNQSEHDVQKFIVSCRAALSKTKYMASFGYAMHNPYDDITEVSNKADAMMYEDKQNYKHRPLLRKAL